MTAPPLEESAARFREQFTRLKTEIQTVIVGQDDTGFASSVSGYWTRTALAWDGYAAAAAWGGDRVAAGRGGRDGRPAGAGRPRGGRVRPPRPPWRSSAGRSTGGCGSGGRSWCGRSSRWSTPARRPRRWCWPGRFAALGLWSGRAVVGVGRAGGRPGPPMTSAALSGEAIRRGREAVRDGREWRMIHAFPLTAFEV